MSPFRCFILVAVLNAVGAPTSESNSQKASHECRALRRSLCADHFGVDVWYGRFPNTRGLGKDDSLVEFFHFFALLRQENYCSYLLHHLLCFLFFPLCSPRCPAEEVTPSRQLCDEAMEVCLPYARVLYGSTFQNIFPEFINCSSLSPESYGVRTCQSTGANNTAESCCSTEGGTHLHSPNATVHVDFCVPIGSRVYQAMENASSVEICIALANTGSYDPTSTLSESITLKLSPRGTKASFLPPAKLGVDYSLTVALVTFPAGSVKGEKRCVQVAIVNDNLKEGRETFSIEATALPPLPVVTFGSGAAHSSSGSIEVIIVDNDEPFIPDDECRGKCSIRNRANPNTFTQNYYTYAAHVEAIEQRDSNHSSLLDMVILDCWELRAAPNSVCPGENRTLSSVPICPDCTLDFQSGKEYLLAGRHVPGSQPGSGLYLPNYRKGGLLAVWKRSYSSVGEWVSAAANQTTVH